MANNRASTPEEIRDAVIGANGLGDPTRDGKTGDVDRDKARDELDDLLRKRTAMERRADDPKKANGAQKLAMAKDPEYEAVNKRLHELHYLVNGEQPPAKK